MQERRPMLTRRLTGAELRRWYWLRTELASFAREVGLSASGGKIELTERIAAWLDGRPPTPPPRAPSRSGQLVPPLRLDDRVPAGQRCSQPVRAWFVDQVGPAFHFDAPMRAWFAAADGTGTLQDALVHWHETRRVVTAGSDHDIEPQFELNRFTRRWHAEHPGGRREELLAAWRRYREQPEDLRDRA